LRAGRRAVDGPRKKSRKRRATPRLMGLRITLSCAPSMHGPGGKSHGSPRWLDSAQPGAQPASLVSLSTSSSGSAIITGMGSLPTVVPW
jgi:hypothetical protein